MENYQTIVNQIINDGYYMMPGNRKAIYDLSIYYRDQQEIMEKDFPDQSSNLSFAVFRATLYHWDLGKDLATDYHLYKQYLQNRELNELRSSTFILPEIMEIKSNNVTLLNKFTEDIASPQKPFIISSFHYSSYKTLVNYLVYKGFTIYLIASKAIIDQNKNNSYFYAKAMNDKLGRNSEVKYICAEDALSMIEIAEIVSDNNIDPKTVFLIFPDGNIGTKRNIDTKRFEPIRFLNKDLWVRKGIFMFAELFDIPIYNVIADSDLNLNIHIEILYHIESPILFKNNNKNILHLFYNVLENYLLSGNLHKWECWVYIHAWHEHLTPPAEDQVLVSLDTYEEKRFTLLVINQDEYIFDSKYYLSYPIKREGLTSLADTILKTNIIL